MKRLIARYQLPAPPIGVPIVRAGTIVWRDKRALIVADPFGTRKIASEWDLYRHELTPDGQFVLSLADDAKRAMIWETRTGNRVLEITGDLDHRQSLRASLVPIGNELFAFVADKKKSHLMSILDVKNGSTRGWIATTGMMWFQVERVVPLEPSWLAIHGRNGGEQYDTVVVLDAREILYDNGILQAALIETRQIKEWGYRVAIGPVGDGNVVIFRDPEWGEDDPPDDRAESFCGLIVRDLSSAQVVQRMEYDGAVANGATLAGDVDRIAIETPTHVEIASRSTGIIQRVEAIGLDPYRLQIAQHADNAVEIAEL